MKNAENALKYLKSKEQADRKAVYIWSIISGFFLVVIIFAILKKGFWYYLLIYVPLLMMHIQHWREYLKLKTLIKDMEKEIQS